MLISIRLLLFDILFKVNRRLASLVGKSYSKNSFRRKTAARLSGIYKHPKKRINGKDFEYALNTSLGMQLFFQNSFEKIQLDYCEKFIKEDSCILDIGANIGIYSFHYAKIARKGLVIAFEPGFQAFQLLTRNVQTFSNVVPLNVAVSDITGTVDFFEAKDSAYSGLSDTGRNQIVEVRKVLCYRPDELLKSLNLPNVDFIKIDVEGFEDQVLNGLMETISQFKPVILCEICERNSGKDPEVTIQKLINNDYEAFIFIESGIAPFSKHDDKYQDYLFIPLKK